MPQRHGSRANFVFFGHPFSIELNYLLVPRSMCFKSRAEVEGGWIELPECLVFKPFKLSYAVEI